MSAPRELESLPLEALARIDSACLRFEKAWQCGPPPDIAAYLMPGPDAEAGELARQLLALDAHYRGAAAVEPKLTTARFVLSVIGGPHQGKSFTFDGHDTFIVGRSKHAHCRLPARDEFFSRIHFVLEVNPPVCRLLDMGSANGTFVNGQRVKVADLKHGDVIHAGQTVLVASVPADADEEASTRLFEPSPTVEGVPGPTLGHYQLLRELGQGGMGKVYLALDAATNNIVALKTILPAVRTGQMAMERFLREADILRQLQHDNIVSFHDMGQAEGRLYFAMDFVPGSDAGHLVKTEGPLAIERGVRLILQLLSALAYAHKKGFVHRDVKPANLMVTTVNGQDVVKVVDFGLARVYHGSKLSGLTITGQVGGTQAFIAPEQITHFRDVKPAADQYAAAATLYHLLTGKYVHDFDAAPRKWLSMIVQAEAVPIRSRRSDIPVKLEEIIQRALAKDPAARFADVREMRRALEPFAEGGAGL